MRRLILWLAALIAVFSLAALIAVQLGRRQPLPERVAMLHLTDCELPCWIGIVPGKTTRGEARQRIYELYDEIWGHGVGFAVREGGAAIEIWTKRADIRFKVFLNSDDIDDDAIVGNLVLDLSGDFTPYLKLAQLHALFGAPDFVSRQDIPSDLGVVYLMRRFSVGTSSFKCVRITGDEVVHSLYLHGEPLNSEQVINGMESWRGFRTCYNRTP
jgi:hypothetical protein